MSKIYLVAVLGCLGAVVGCGETVRESVRCQLSCEWAQECVNDDLDVDACHDDCADVIDNDSALSAKARDCERCVAGEECDDTDECEDDCFEVLDEANADWRE